MTLHLVASERRSDMLDEWQTEAIDLAVEALKGSTVDRDIAEAIKKEFDKRVRSLTLVSADLCFSIPQNGIASWVHALSLLACFQKLIAELKGRALAPS